MGTFTTKGLEYDGPDIPIFYDGTPGLSKAYQRGWCQGIWNDRRVDTRRYKVKSFQAAYEAGHLAARLQRSAAGDVVTE